MLEAYKIVRMWVRRPWTLNRPIGFAFMTPDEFEKAERAWQDQHPYDAAKDAKAWKARFFWLLFWVIVVQIYLIVAAHEPQLSPQQWCARGDCWWYGI